MLNQPLLKRRKRHQFCLKLLGVLCVLGLASAGGYYAWYYLRAKPAPSPVENVNEFQYVTEMGSDVSLFVRQHAPSQPQTALVSTQLRLRPGILPTITFAWPAGNTGICLIFNASAANNTQAVNLSFVPSSAATTIVNNSNYGLTASVVATLPSTLPYLHVNDVVLGSMRAVRDARQFASTNLTRFMVTFDLAGNQVLKAERWSIDNVSFYSLTLRVLAPATAVKRAEGWVLVPEKTNTIQFEMIATSTETLLTPVPTQLLLSSTAFAASTERSRNELAFLTYEESLLAGADNYLTMFGRDNQFVLAIGAQDFEPKAFEIVFASHLEGMRADGNLMHEPSIGEWAAVMNEEIGIGDTRIPIYYDYKMIDTRFLLAMNVLAYAQKVGKESFRKFFNSSKTSHGVMYHDALLMNLQFVKETAEPFYLESVWNNLVKIEHETVGNWRDSKEGLGNGKYPFDVNAVLVAAALKAIVGLAKLIGDDADLNALSQQCDPMITSWSTLPYEMFQVSVLGSDAQELATSYGSSLGYNYTGGLPNSTLTFSAVSLDEDGTPVGIMNSDGGFMLLYNMNATDAMLLQIASQAVAPFPYGLFSPMGMFTSNGAYANKSFIPQPWDFHGYHMVVVWPWQEFLMVQGLANQLQRTDLMPTTKTALENAELELWRMLYATIDYLSIELYSPSVHNNTLKPSAYGEGAGDQTVSTVIQLWSKLSLVVRPPSRVTRVLGPMNWATVQVPKFWPSN